MTFDNTSGRNSALFVAAAMKAIDALHSQAFEADLRAFVSAHAQSGKHSAAWQGVEASAIIGELRGKINGLVVTTYGGPYGWWLSTFYGNTAYEGTGPIRLNRAALPRPIPSIANTFAHEAAHRVGLGHPTFESDKTVGRCEPPYVIGSLVEKHAMGAAWRPGINDCGLLKP